MGAFGPSGMFDLWPDDVWDMNEQVMYWLAAASNRPDIADPMLKYMESGQSHGGGYNVCRSLSRSLLHAVPSCLPVSLSPCLFLPRSRFRFRSRSLSFPPHPPTHPDRLSF